MRRRLDWHEPSAPPPHRYGHGNDVFALAAHPSGRLLASACTAKSAAAAAVWLWAAPDWTPLCQLAGHQLTVSQLAFSNSGRCGFCAHPRPEDVCLRFFL